MNNKKFRRTIIVSLLLIAAYLGLSYFEPANVENASIKNQVATAPTDAPLALDTLNKIPIKGRAPKTDYARNQFGNGWAEIGSCDVRNLILKRDLQNVVVSKDNNCHILSGKLTDPYTGKNINFSRGPTSSQEVQIDHVVALSDAWQKGAQLIDRTTRENFANDSLNLLAVDGGANQQKGDGDAATWLPANKKYRCAYVARQIAVKFKYGLWVTSAEHNAIKRVLNNCPNQPLPITNNATKDKK